VVEKPIYHMHGDITPDRPEFTDKIIDLHNTYM
jgi:hypothetical protein